MDKRSTNVIRTACPDQKHNGRRLSSYPNCLQAIFNFSLVLETVIVGLDPRSRLLKDLAGSMTDSPGTLRLLIEIQQRLQRA
jgi:hypothetical protein